MAPFYYGVTGRLQAGPGLVRACPDAMLADGLCR